MTSLPADSVRSPKVVFVVEPLYPFFGETAVPASYEVLEEAVFGAGHFLGHPQTLELMQSEYLYPQVADRETPGTWEEMGSKSLYEQAHERVKEMLSSHYPQYIDPAADARIRERFPIRLDAADMQPGNGRW